MRGVMRGRFSAIAEARTRHHPAGQAGMQMVRIAEWANGAFRTFSGIIATYLVYPTSPTTLVWFGFLLLLNAVTIWLSVRGRGPLTRGPLGVTAEMFHTALATVVVGAVMPEQTYLSRAGVIPFGIYGAGLAALLFVYPRPDLAGIRGRVLKSPLTDFLAPLALIPLFLFAASLNGYKIDQVPLADFFLHACWTVAGTFLGYVMWLAGRTFARAEAAAIEETYEGFSNWLHSHVKGYIGVLRRYVQQPGSDLNIVDQQLGELAVEVHRERLALLLRGDDLSVAEILAHHISRFRWRFEFESVPRVSGWRVDPVAAKLLDRTLGDLLSNAGATSAQHIWIGMARRNGELSVVLSDDDRASNSRRRQGRRGDCRSWQKISNA